VLYKYDLVGQKLSFISQLSRSGRQWNSLLQTQDGFIGVQHTAGSNGYFFTVSKITPSGVVTDIASTEQNDTFVNFFWAEFDPVKNNVYILSGDEDSLFDLGVVLYSVSLTTTKSYVVPLDNSKFTLSNFHVNINTGQLYSVSPGLFGASSWTLVTINPMTGAILPVAPIQNSDKWEFGFGGGVYNGLSADGKTLTQTFTWKTTGATAMTVIDVATGAILYLTDIDLGVNNEKRLTGIIAY